MGACFSMLSHFLQCDKEIQLWNNKTAWPKNVIEGNILKCLHYNKAQSCFLCAHGNCCCCPGVWTLAKRPLEEKQLSNFVDFIFYFDGVLDQNHMLDLQCDWYWINANQKGSFWFKYCTFVLCSIRVAVTQFRNTPQIHMLLLILVVAQ